MFGEYTATNGELVTSAMTIWHRMLADGVTTFSGGGYDNAGANIRNTLICCRRDIVFGLKNVLAVTY